MMEDLLRVLFFLCAFAAPGNSLTCLKCMAMDSTCSGVSVTCPTDSSCGLFYRQTTEGGKTTEDYIKSCVPSNNCSTVGSISYIGGQMKMGISCCNTDNCTPRLPKLPADSTEDNGVTCPTCSSLTSIYCDSHSDIQCTGNEQTCINQNTMILAPRDSQDSVKGCASQSICDMKDFYYLDDRNLVLMSFLCGSGTNSAVTSDTNNTPPSCVICGSVNSLDCVGKLQQCPLNHVCASAYNIMSIDGEKQNMVFRSCIPKNKCGVSGTMSLTRGNVQMGTSCCDEDGCTPSIKPPKNSGDGRPNGVQCKTCMAVNADSCEATNTMECSGDEDQCVNYAMTQSKGPTGPKPGLFSFRGCGVQALCSIQSYSTTINNVEIENHFSCTKGKTDPSNGGNNMTGPSNGVISVSLLLTVAVALNIHLIKDH